MQSKNQLQNTMIHEMDHLIRENDELNKKHSLLINENNNHQEKQKQYQNIVR